MQYLEQCNPKGVKDILQSETPSIAIIMKDERGEAVCRAILVKLINNLNDFANVNKPMNATQVAETVVLQLEKYPSAKVDDFVLAFKKIKQGCYGTFYGGIDGNVIGDMICRYFEDKQKEVVTLNLTKSKIRIEESKEQIKLPEGEINYPPVSEWFKPKQAEIKPSKPRKLSEQDLLLNSLMNQFDAIHKHRTIKRFTKCIGQYGKFIKRNGKMMGIDDFLNHKVAQALMVRDFIYQRRLEKLKPYLEFRKNRDSKTKAA